MNDVAGFVVLDMSQEDYDKEIRNKAIDEMVDGIREILECNAIYNIDCIVTLANRMKDGE